MNPIIPGSKRDRTGSSSILRKAIAEIDRRFAGLQGDVIAAFDRLPVYSLNELGSAPRVDYGAGPQELAATSEAIQQALDRWIEEGKEPNQVAWWTYSEDAAQLGTAQTVANLANLSAAYSSARSLSQVIYSRPYRDRVLMAQIKSYDHWTAASAEMRSSLSQIIGRAIVDGKNPKAVRKEIAERLDVSKSKAIAYAQTDITDTLRQARLEEADAATAQFGLNIGLLWTSALLPTTRPSHAIRNGKVYTSSEVRNFYSKNGNLFRCHCSCTETLLDEDGKPILTDKLKATMLAEREAWEKANA